MSRKPLWVRKEYRSGMGNYSMRNKTQNEDARNRKDFTRIMGLIRGRIKKTMAIQNGREFPAILFVRAFYILRISDQFKERSIIIHRSEIQFVKEMKNHEIPMLRLVWDRKGK